ncbi:MAG: hypothetical protein ACE366_18095 [Bradymonadia bacterium]
MKTLLASLSLVALLTSSAMAGTCYEDSAVHGRDMPSFAPNNAYGLESFRFKFTNGDHHIRRIAVEAWKRGSTDMLSTSLADKGNNDPYEFRVCGVKLDKVPGVKLGTAKVSGRGTGWTSLGVNQMYNYEFVIRGFDLQFKQGDRELRKIMVEYDRNTRRLNVHFKDDGNPYFTAEIQYAWVPRSRLIPLGTPKKSVNMTRFNSRAFAGGKGQDTMKLKGQRGKRMLQSFEFTYKDATHHMDELVLNLWNGAAALNDKNNDDIFRLETKYVVLR